MTIGDIKPYERNAKKHDKKQIELLAKNIERFGFDQPIVLWRKTNEIIKGHGRFEAAKLLGFTECKEATIAKPGERFIPIEFQDYADEHEANAARIADNQIHDLTGVDMSLITDDLKALPDDLLELTGFDSDLVIEPEERDDEVPEAPVEPQSKLGDLYELGNHRVLCGDSTKLEDVEMLMDGEKADMVFTDPPYGMDLDTDYTKMGDGGKKYDAVIADNVQFNASQLLSMFSYCKEIFLWGADYYVETLGRQYPNLGSWVIWDKYSDSERAGLLDGRFGSTFETCWSKTAHKREIARVLVTTNYTARGDETRVHPTQKPVQLGQWFFKRWGKVDDIVVDLFLGSGSTLIACEQTDRTCYGMELDPKYVDVIVQRYVDYTGNATIKKNGQDITWKKTEPKPKKTESSLEKSVA